MATISKIASSSDLPVIPTHQKSGRTLRTDAGHSNSKNNPEISKPKGVEPVLKEQGQKELAKASATGTQMLELVDKVQEALDQATREQHKVGFRQDSRSDTFVIEITDKDGNIVRQFPPEKVLNLYRKMDELSGMVVDEMT